MGQKCEWCGLIHETKCSLVKAIEYHPDGTVKRVEFFEPPQVQYDLRTMLVGAAMTGAAQPIPNGRGYSWPGPGPEPQSWWAPDGTKVYRSYEDYVDD